MCHQNTTVYIYACIYIHIHAHLKVHYMQAELVRKGFRVTVVYGRHARERIYKKLFLWVQN